MKRIKEITFIFVMALIVVLCGSCKRKDDQVDELVRCLNERDKRES